ncbi:serine hydrolase [Niallia circulans]
MYPASLTKIATAIYAIENGKLDDIVTVSENAYSTEGTKVYLEKGEQVTLRHLLDGMLINSGNDAAIAIAEYLDGTVSDFETSINKYLKEKVNVHSTHFKNPNGLFDKDHYTTANDLALITQYAMKNETFREIFGTDELKWDGLSWDTTLVSHHQMVNGSRPYDKVTGGKTGYVDESKQTLATTAENGS